MKPSELSRYAVQKTWDEINIGFRVANAGFGIAVRENKREKRLLLASRRAIPYAECLKRLLARS